MKINTIASQWLAVGWLLIVSLVVLQALRQETLLDSSIIALLPESEQQPMVQQATDQLSNGFSQHLILLISGQDEENVRAAVQSLAITLAELSDVSSVKWRVGSEVNRYGQELFPYRFSILDHGVRNLLQAGEYEQLKQRALLRLYSPLSVGSANLISDPFGLSTELSLNQKAGLNIKISNSLFKVSATELPTYMLAVRLAGDPFLPSIQHSVLGAINEQKSQLAHSGISISMSGMLIHAEAGARQASQEISTIGIGSLLGIILVMLVVFHRLKPLLLILFAIAIGCVTAAAVTMLAFDRVHLITFAFGAGLVGVSVDYALHFICERCLTPGKQVLRKIISGLLLGLLSSVIAYSALALTPFPGLQQMAVFSVVGLIASWLTVVLWFPLLTRGSSGQALSAVSWLGKIRQRFPRLNGNPWLTLSLSLLFVLAMSALWNSDTLDDIRLLQTSPEDLLAEEKHVQQSLGVTSSSQFLLVTADNLEMCLQIEESLADEISSLKSEALLEGYQALSLLLPSLQRQQENRELVGQLYEQQLRTFFDTLSMSDDQLVNAQQQFSQSKNKLLTPDDWLQQQSSNNWRELIVSDDETAATVIRFTGALDEAVKLRLRNLAESTAGVTYVDKVQNISDLMANYRAQLMYWIAIAYFCVLLVLLYRYKKQVWRVVLPPLLASVYTLAIVSHFEQGLNLFHLMALILVLGIGLDMGVFMMETNDAPHTWLAVSLSTYTSLLAFGMLAWSNTPVLHHFGLTVLFGLGFVWLLTALLRKSNSEEIFI